MELQSKIWLRNLLSIGVKPSDIYIHLIGKIPEAYEKYLISSGINCVYKEVFDSRNKYCNKLVQLETFRNRFDFDFVFFMDCDTAIVSLENFQPVGSCFAKVVDFPNPPLNLLEKIFLKAKLPIYYTETTYEWEGYNLTDWNNCNGGVYVFSAKFLNIFEPYWKDYVHWCLDHNDLFSSKYIRHADQVGFALAMGKLNRRVSHLGIEWNFPTHLPVKITNVRPQIIHFHQKVDSESQILKTGVTKIDEQISIVNKRMME